jgi:hypothetical protein
MDKNPYAYFPAKIGVYTILTTMISLQFLENTHKSLFIQQRLIKVLKEFGKIDKFVSPVRVESGAVKINKKNGL